MRSIVCVFALAIVASAAQAPERLDRGLIAVVNADGQVYLGWRLLAADPPGIAFHVDRSTAGRRAVRLTKQPITESTNFVDAGAPLDRENTWLVTPVLRGREQKASARVSLPAGAPRQNYIPIKLQGAYTPNKIALGDLNGDGKLDFVIKQPGASIDPGAGYWRRSSDTYKIEAYRHDGTFLWRKDLGWNIEQGIWYSPMVVFDLTGDGKAEVALRTAPTDEDYRDKDGHVLAGPEYVSVWDGLNGREIARADWIARGDPAAWGDKTGNRASRHMIGVAYLDGKRASLIVHRGTYTTMRVDAYNFVGAELRRVWSWNGDNEAPQVRGQGMHGMKVADVDADGRDEIILGSAALDDNGRLLWNLDLGHPDVVYVADVDPSRPGLEIAYGVEVKRADNGICLADARTGKIIWGARHPTTHIHDQGMVADIDPNSPGMEIYGAEADGSKFWLYSAQGEILATENMGGNSPHALFWDAGPVKAYIPGPSRFRRPAGAATPAALPRPPGNLQAPRILNYKGEQIGELTGRILVIADVIGDWREEVITSVDGELRIYTTTIPATTRRVTLMQDRLYRNDVALASMGYYFPPQLGGAAFQH